MAKSIDAGALRRRITIQKKSLKTDDYGDKTEGDWGDVCSVWACIDAIGAREFWEAQAAHGELTHRVTIRYREGITADMRILYGERKFDLVAPPVDQEERHRYLILKCREVTT